MNKNCSFYDEKGNLRDLETILNEVAAIYEEEKNSAPSCLGSGELLDTILSMEPINEKEIYNSSDFLCRTIYLEGIIEESTSKDIIQAINFWNLIDDREEVKAENRQPITMLINTDGGDLNATFSIIDAIKTSVTPVHTITTGKGYSGGFFIGISGHKRYGFKHSSYLFHEGSTCNIGDAHKYLQEANFYSERLKELKDIVLSSTSINEEYYNKHRKDDLWFNAEKALKYGIIDEILTTNYLATIPKEENDNDK